MAFKFRLEKVLEHRKRLEDEAKRVYFAAVDKTHESLAKLESMYQAIDDVRVRGHELQKGVVGHNVISTLQETDGFIRGQKVRIDRQRDVIRELKAEEERLQELLVEAARERKALEKLREKQLHEYKTAIERREVLEADDLSVMRHGRGEGP